MNNSDIQLSFWALTLRPLARRTLPFLLLAFDLLFVGFALQGGFQFVKAEVQNDAIAAALGRNIVPTNLLQERFQHPTPIVASAVLLPTVAKQYSLLASIRNPSQHWAATAIAYSINIGETPLAQGTTTLLPGEEKFLVAADKTLSQSQTPSSAVNVTFTDASWIRSTAVLSLPKREIDVLNPQFRVLSGGTPALSQIVATVKNTSVAAYPEVEVVAVLMRGQTPLAVATVLLHNLAGEEERAVDLRLLGAYDATNAIVKASPTTLPDTRQR